MPHIVKITQKNGSDIANEPTQGVLMAQIDLGTDFTQACSETQRSAGLTHSGEGGGVSRSRTVKSCRARAPLQNAKRPRACVERLECNELLKF